MGLIIFIWCYKYVHAIPFMTKRLYKEKIRCQSNGFLLPSTVNKTTSLGYAGHCWGAFIMSDHPLPGELIFRKVCTLEGGCQSMV